MFKIGEVDVRLAWITRLASSFAAFALLCGIAQAQSIIPGNYPPGGFTSSRANIQAPPGTWILENGTLSYQTREFVDGSGNTSKTGTVDVLVNRTLIGRVTDFKILGGDFFPAIVVPFANAPTRPEAGSKRSFQLGDVVLQPVGLGWHAGEWHSSVSWNVFTPTGRFTAGQTNNVGKGLTSHMFTGGVTWLQDASLPWAATATLRYEVFGKQDTTGIKPGQVLTLEGGFAKEIAPGFDIGLLGYVSGQVSRERGSAPGTDTTKYRTAAIGPELTWRPKALPGAIFSFRYYREVTSRNTSRGDLAVLSLGYAF